MKYNSKQEVFDAVVAHAESMNELSVNDKGQCIYRGDNGCKCLVGALIEDQDYDPEFEGINVDGLENRGLLPEYLWGHVDLLSECQLAHDSFSDDDDEDDEYFKPVMIENLKKVAVKFNLQYNGVL